MKKIGLILLMFLATCAASAVTIREWGDEMNPVREIDSLNDRVEALRNSDTLLVRQLANRALELSIRNYYFEGQTRALLLLASSYLSQSEFAIGLDYYYKVLDIYERGDHIQQIAEQYSRIIELYINIKDFDLAETNLKTFARLTAHAKNPSVTGLFYITSAKYGMAAGMYDQALLHAYSALACISKTGNNLTLGAAYKYLADALVQKKKFAPAEYNYRLAIARIRKDSNFAELGVLYTRLAHVYQVRSNEAKSLEYNLKALNIRQQYGTEFLIASSNLNVGEAYWLIGRRDSATHYIDIARAISQKNHFYKLLTAIYEQLTEFAKQDSDYKNALEYHKICTEYRAAYMRETSRAEIHLIEANRSIRASQAQNELLRKENQIGRLQIRNSKIRMFLFEVLFLVILASIFAVDTLTRKNRRRRNELKELNERLSREIVIREEAENRLRRSEELHRFLAENTIDVISLLDSKFKRLYISPSSEKFYGYSKEDILTMQSPLDLVDPSFREEVENNLAKLFKTRKPVRYIYKVKRKDGSSFWAESHINPILDPASGEVRNMITVVRDISTMKKHEEEISEHARQKEYLLHEIHNRVKNNFAILVSLMNMQRNDSAGQQLAGSLTDLQLRIRTMSLVHEQLYLTKEISHIPFDSYLHHLALIIASSFNNNRISILTELEPCKVSIEMALPLGLILNELITNAFKYAFPDERSGSIRIRLAPEPDGCFSVSVADDGIGLPDDFSVRSTQSMGSQIVGILVDQIEAKLHCSTDRGACFRIVFTVENT